VFATVPIPYATVIMRDRLVLRYETNEELQQTHRRYLRLLPPIREEILNLGVHQDIERCAAVGVKLILDGERRGIIPKIMHLDAVLSTNAFSLSPDDPKSPAGLFLNASRLNHSCVPNADHSYDNKSGYKSVFANRDVDVGEEITISYSDHTKPRVMRQVDMKAWGFICQCPACDVRHPDNRAHERRLKRLARLRQDHYMDNVGRLKDGVRSSKSMLWLAAKKAQKRIELLTGHHSLQKFSRQAYVTSLYFSREPSLYSLLTVQADIWEPLTSPSHNIS
jgi:hypothetical protein